MQRNEADQLSGARVSRHGEVVNCVWGAVMIKRMERFQRPYPKEKYMNQFEALDFYVVNSLNQI